MGERPPQWGRWGDEDERGALNLLTPERVLAALSIPTQGMVYNLGAEVRSRGVPMATGRPLPSAPMLFFTVDGGDYAAGGRLSDGLGSAEDMLFMPVHGSATHIDSLGHVWIEDQLYNGFPSASVRSQGMRRLGIQNVGHIVARGVLLDIAGAHGVDYLTAGYEIAASELAAAERAHGVQVRPGDVVLVRTGWGKRFLEDPDEYTATAPGLGAESARWLAERDVVAVGADTLALEVLPSKPGATMPVHRILLHEHGIYILELLELDGLADDGVHEFLFVALPLRIRGATGSPLNPIAIA